MPITMHDFQATNRRGELCEPHKYPDGRFRAVRYRPGDPKWKDERYYVIFPERDLGEMCADPGLLIRMSVVKDRKSPALFSTRNIRRLGTAI